MYYEGLQDKLTQIKDARAALDALREEHKEKLRRRAEEAERQRQMLMAQKLAIMRKKKQEYLQYQRQLALRKIQEQEREMQMRQEQQKQQYIMGNFLYFITTTFLKIYFIFVKIIFILSILFLQEAIKQFQILWDLLKDRLSVMSTIQLLELITILCHPRIKEFICMDNQPWVSILCRAITCRR